MRGGVAVHGNCRRCCLDCSCSDLHAAGWSQTVNSKRGSTSSCEGNRCSCSSPAEIVLTVLVSLSIVIGALGRTRAEALVHWGELSSGRHALEGALPAPGNEETRRALTDERRRPPMLRAPLSDDLLTFQPESALHFQTMLGCECIGHILQSETDASPNRTVLSIDGIGRSTLCPVSP